jgi:hypothetical protein
MYTREIQAPRVSPVLEGKPVKGTWTQAFDKVDLLEIRRPFSFPFPPWMRNFRVKEWESFIVQNDQIYLEAFLANIKYYGFAEVFFLDKETKKTERYVKVVPWTGLWRFPQNLSNSSLESRFLGFFFRIHTWLDADSIEVDLDLEATFRQPAFTAHLEYDTDSKKSTPMAVNLLFSEDRSMYTYKSLNPVRGAVVYNGRRIALESASTTGLFRDCKGLYPYRMRSVCCSGFGFDAEAGRYGFSVAENQANETNKDNENALWVNGRLTPLPPVRITHSGGLKQDWVIQDVEGMVDLTFSPQKQIDAAFNLLLTKSAYHTPVGLFNGMLVNQSGGRIAVRNLWGTGEKLYLRV